MKSKARAEELTALTESVRAHIFRDGRRPGDRVETEEELARKFSVSRHQVRRVLNTMVQQGLLNKTPRRGTFIRQFDPSLVANNLKSSFQVSEFGLNEYIEARLVIEQAVLPLAIKRITPEQIDQLQSTIDRMIDLEHEPEKADEADRDFHMTLLAACGNQILSSFSTIIAHLFHDSAYRSRYWDSATIDRLAKEHRKILKAITDGDTERALKLHEQHLHYRRRLNLDSSARKPPRRTRRPSP